MCIRDRCETGKFSLCRRGFSITAAIEKSRIGMSMLQKKLTNFEGLRYCQKNDIKQIIEEIIASNWILRTIIVCLIS